MSLGSRSLRIRCRWPEPYALVDLRPTSIPAQPGRGVVREVFSTVNDIPKRLAIHRGTSSLWIPHRQTTQSQLGHVTTSECFSVQSVMANYGKVSDPVDLRPQPFSCPRGPCARPTSDPRGRRQERQAVPNSWMGGRSEVAGGGPQIRTCLIRGLGVSCHDFAGHPLIAHPVIRAGRNWLEDVRLDSIFDEVIKATPPPVTLRYIKLPEQDSLAPQLSSESECSPTRVHA